MHVYNEKKAENVRTVLYNAVNICVQGKITENS